MIESALILSFSLLLDQLLGEPRRFHPLVGFGWCVDKLESIMNRGKYLRLKGLIAVSILLLPLLFLSHYGLNYFAQQPVIWLADVLIIYLAIGHKSLMQHASAIMLPLSQSDIATARTNLSYIVSRDTGRLQKPAVIIATVESVIENSNDAIFAAIFWYLLAGVPGVICYRLINTLDAMWGYKNKRFLEFGRAAAKLDDAMNWIPARLTVLTFALFGNFKRVLITAFEQGALCSSPNAGPVMAAGACSLNVKLGGDAFYQGVRIAKPQLGYGDAPQLKTIQQAMRLVNKSLLLWLSVIILFAVIIEVI
ncbi:MAG: adenosylcobinamide-phosphate synthase CbiB [Gammaproteobacteria bacterium]|nr:adenosylcobinamide-phosphate synthase CbiB [Gammaproteobacteria bacterium]